MRALATEVGVQAGALYNYTPDKKSTKPPDQEPYPFTKRLLLLSKIQHMVPIYLRLKNLVIFIPD